MACLTELSRLPTSGARAVEPFQVDGATFLAVPQLALDIPGQPPNMNGGNSDTDLLVYRLDCDEFSWSTEARTVRGPGLRSSSPAWTTSATRHARRARPKHRRPA